VAPLPIHHQCHSLVTVCDAVVKHYARLLPHLRSLAAPNRTGPALLLLSSSSLSWRYAAAKAILSLGTTRCGLRMADVADSRLVQLTGAIIAGFVAEIPQRAGRSEQTWDRSMLKKACLGPR
jgi:hypothetical protein